MNGYFLENDAIISLSLIESKQFALSAKGLLYKPVSKPYLTVNNKYPPVLSLPLVIIL